LLKIFSFFFFRALSVVPAPVAPTEPLAPVGGDNEENEGGEEEEEEHHEEEQDNENENENDDDGELPPGMVPPFLRGDPIRGRGRGRGRGIGRGIGRNQVPPKAGHDWGTGVALGEDQTPNLDPPGPSRLPERDVQDIRDRREAAMRRVVDLPGPSTAPVPLSPTTDINMDQAAENPPRATAEHRDLMIAASLRRLENLPSSSAPKAKRTKGTNTVLMSLEDIAVGVVGGSAFIIIIIYCFRETEFLFFVFFLALLVSKQSLNPVKSLRGVSKSVGEKLLRYLLKKDQLDYFSLSKLSVW